MVSVKRTYPRVVYLGVKRRVNSAAIRRNVGHGDRKLVKGAGVVDVDGSRRTAQCQSVSGGIAGGPLEGNGRRAKGRSWRWTNHDSGTGSRRGCWSGSRCWLRGGGGCWSRSWCRTGVRRGGRCRTSYRRRTWRRGRCWITSRRSNTNIINVLLLVKGSGVGNISSGIVGHNGNVIAHFVLVRVTEKWIERLAHCHIG
jgi:hypothetical protein